MSPECPSCGTFDGEWNFRWRGTFDGERLQSAHRELLRVFLWLSARDIFSEPVEAEHDEPPRIQIRDSFGRATSRRSEHQRFCPKSRMRQGVTFLLARGEPFTGAVIVRRAFTSFRAAQPGPNHIPTTEHSRVEAGPRREADFGSLQITLFWRHC